MSGILDSIPVIGDLVDSISEGLDELFTSDEEMGQIDVEKKKAEITRLVTELKAQHMQLQINLAQANHPSMFVAGARPAIIWIGAFGLFYEAIFRPIANWIIRRSLEVEELLKLFQLQAPTLDNIQAALEIYMLPSLNENLYMPIVLGVLGIGGMRTYEKFKGKARDNFSQPTSVQEFEQLATLMRDRLKAQAEGKSGPTAANSAIESFKAARTSPKFTPYFPGEDELT